MADKDEVINRCCKKICSEVKKYGSTIYTLTGVENSFRAEIVKNLRVSGYCINEFKEDRDIVVRREFI